jgi:hypothetical protein
MRTIQAAIPLLPLSCAPGLQFVSMTPEDDRQVQVAWGLARELVDYDYYSWIASDSASSHRSSLDVNAVRGWVAVMEGYQKVVIFGALVDTGLKAVFRVPFVSNVPGPCISRDTLYPRSSDAYLGFRAMQNMRDIFKQDFDSLRVPMNSYVLFHGDTLLVYFFPGSTDRYINLCGGYRAKYLKTTMEPIERAKLHRSPLVLDSREQPEGMVASVRTSSQTDLINEVDIAQTLIVKDRLPDQIVMTKKYLYVFHKDKDTGRMDFKTAKKN